MKWYMVIDTMNNELRKVVLATSEYHAKTLTVGPDWVFWIGARFEAREIIQ